MNIEDEENLTPEKHRQWEEAIEKFLNNQEDLPPEFQKMESIKEAKAKSKFSECWEPLKNTPFLFWVCPAGCRGYVDWRGAVATCRECGKRSDAR